MEFFNSFDFWFHFQWFNSITNVCSVSITYNRRRKTTIKRRWKSKERWEIEKKEAYLSLQLVECLFFRVVYKKNQPTKALIEVYIIIKFWTQLKTDIMWASRQNVNKSSKMTNLSLSLSLPHTQMISVASLIQICIYKATFISLLQSHYNKWRNCIAILIHDDWKSGGL